MHKVMTAKSAQSDFENMFYEVTRFNEPVTVVSEDNLTVVIINIDEWNSIQETLYLHSIPGMVESNKAAAAEPLEDGIPVSEVDFGV
jgi:PHD/YefM family antitoxin component YafN of YafNO toxin-antitoxin module